ncbi:C4-dicarboxylate ABC transporter permease [Oceanobacillus arenosus]|uniref:C4-dicarboxylate ABC transporter permease n=1 Tax=Oceanobacillus arenosus TaxID=1229153 RepID=A0A3D8PY70_9BACI|nr:AbgT family transporter [Oceanobacillus arenosus]RDW20271.1 C4-dicarboxylate ABC transporter permease [Oceanobacillus arenosus]
MLAEKGKNPEPKNMEKSKIPHTFIILFGIIVLLAITTYFIPAGEYDRETTEDGRTIVINGTYHETDASPAGFLDIFTAVFDGMVQSADIIFLLFIVGGSFGILTSTGAIEGLFNRLITKLKGNEIYLIPILITFFAICGATFGMAEESIPYLIILLPFLLKLGFDRIIAVAAPMIGTAIGYAGGVTNPFNVGVAQGIAELPLFSGMFVRIVLLAILIIITNIYVMRYARKILKSPERSLVYRERPFISEDENPTFSHQLTKSNGVILIIFLLTILIIPFGIINYGWYMKEIASLFLIMGVIVGIIAKMKYNQIAESFAKGCNDMVVAALAVGLAHGAVVILENANAIDTIVYSLSGLIEGLPSTVAVAGIYGVQNVINYIVSSGSGQAALTMPLIAPLADLVEVNRQTAVLAFQIGDGISNALTPTNGQLMASLAIAGLSWIKWARFLIPLLIILYIVGLIYLLCIHLFIWV